MTGGKVPPTLITECKASKEVEFDTNQRLIRLRLICIAKQPHIFHPSPTGGYCLEINRRF
jgi:hypothetical protein